MNWKKIAWSAYPLLIIAGVLVMMLREARAGQVRELEISPDMPGIVHLAFGRTTAISFSVRPEKVVPGSPQAIDVNFLGKDITIRPLNSKAGNLLVYTKNSRFVILFQVGSDTQYDDVVKIAPAFSKHPLKLIEDSYRIIPVMISTEPKGKNFKSIEVPVSVRANDRAIEGNELRDALQPYVGLVCTGCIAKHDGDSLRLTCATAIHELHCHSAGTRILIRRGSS